jgi:WD40 repeat protein
VLPRIPDHELLRRVGKGSYGEVWLGRNIMGTYRAVKIIYRYSFETARPFERELSGIQRFEPVSRQHDGLVDILQVGRNDPEGYFYYVMELADPAGAQDSSSVAPNQKTIDSGESSDTQLLYARLPAFAATYQPRTLAYELERRGRLPFEECLPLFLSLASALSHLHQHGLIHRDIKPSNIIFVNGVAKLADIGLVSEAGQSDSYVGTEGYIPPEGPGTVQADIYSLGKLFYELSTGQDRTRFPALPLEPGTLAQNKGLLELNAVFVKACAGEARDRYASAEEMLADLALLQSGKSLRRLRTVERRLVQATRTGLVAAALFLLAATAYLFTHYQARVAQTNFERAETQRLRAERAEQNATMRLCSAYLAQARAGRRSGQVGQRFETLAAISNAVALAGTNDLQLRLALRNEAIATLALTDLQPIQTRPLSMHAPNWPPFDMRLERYVDFDAEGNLSLATMSDGKQILRLATGLRIPALGGFTPNGRFFAAMGNDWLCRVWNLETRQIIFEDPSCAGLNIWRVTPDSRFLVFGFGDGTCIFRSVESGETNRSLHLPAGLYQFAFRPDGQTFAIWNPNTTELEIRETESGKLLKQWPHPIEARDMAWSPSGQRLATAGFDRNGYIWNAESGACLQTLRGHASVVVGIAFLGGDDLVASRSWDSTLRFWDVAHGRQLLESRGAGGRFRFDPRTRRLALVAPRGERSSIELKAVLGGEVAAELWEQIPFTNNGPWTIDFSGDGRLLASGSPDGIRVWDLTEENRVVHIPGGLTFVSFGPKGDSVLSCSEKELWTWPLDCSANGEVVIGAHVEQAIPGKQEKFLYASATPQGSVFVSTEAGPIKGFRYGTNFLELAHSPGAMLVTTSPDGNWIAGSHPWQPGAVLWRAADGRQVRRIATSSGCTVCFSPDSRWLVTGAVDEFCFWEVASGSQGLRIKREQQPGVGGPAAFSHDGKVLAVSLSQWLVALVDVATGRELARLEHPDPQIISCLAFNPSGTQLAVATQGHVIQLWDLRRLSRELAALGLDWEHPPFPSEESKPVPAHLRLAVPLQAEAP